MALFTSIWDVLPVLSSLLVVYVINFYYRYFTRPNPLPGPIPLPLLGNLPQILRSDFSTYVVNLQSKYGDMYEVYTGIERRICIAKAQLAENLIGQSPNSVFFARAFHDLFAELDVHDKGTIFNDDVSSWRYNRKLLVRTTTSPEFLRDLARRTSVLLNEMVGYWFNLGSEEVAEIDLVPWIVRFTTDIIVNSITARRAYALTAYHNSLVPPAKRAKVEQEIFEDSNRMMGLLKNYVDCQDFFLKVPPWLRRNFLPWRLYQNKYLAKVKQLNDEVLKIIRARRLDIAATPRDVPLNTDLLTFLMTANTERDSNWDSEDPDGRPLTEDEIKALIRETFVAGSDTTAFTFAFAVYYLSKNKHVIQRLQEELDRVLGTGSARRSATYDDLNNMPYCEAVIKETLRVMPISFMLLKHAAGEAEVGGYMWPSGQDFIVNLSALHHDPTRWRDPHRFDPERWLEAPPEKNSYRPFGAGMRVCPGRTMATVELRILLAELFSNYDVELVNPDAPLKYVYTLLNQCEELQIRVSRRTGRTSDCLSTLELPVTNVSS